MNIASKDGSLDSAVKEENLTTASNEAKDSTMEGAKDDQSKEDPKPGLSERRKALFEPLEPMTGGKLRTPAEVLLPPPDFDSTSYPKGWLLGKRRKLVNVDVVESMRRIAVQEMNRKVCCLSFILSPRFLTKANQTAYHVRQHPTSNFLVMQADSRIGRLMG